MFVLCPELMVSRLLTEVLDDNETLVVSGHERYSAHAGYAASFRWTADHVDCSERDAWGRRTTQVVAMDAQVRQSQKSPVHHHRWRKLLGRARHGPSTFGPCGLRLSLARPLLILAYTRTHTHPCNGPFFRDYPGEPVPQR